MMEALVSRYQPQRIEDFIGLAPVKAVLLKLVANPFSSAYLLLGPSGLGKTTIAIATASAIGGQLHHIGSTECTVARVEKLIHDCQFHPMLGGNWHTAVVDETDSITPVAQKSFLSILDTTRMPANSIFLFTANATNLLQDRFLSRVRTLTFNPPSDDELAAFLAKVWRKEKATGKRPDFAAIAKSARRNVRSALMTLETEILVPGSFVPAPEPPVAIHVVNKARSIIVDGTEHPEGCPCPHRRCAAKRAWVTMRANIATHGTLKRKA